MEQLKIQPKGPIIMCLPIEITLLDDFFLNQNVMEVERELALPSWDGGLIPRDRFGIIFGSLSNRLALGSNFKKLRCLENRRIHGSQLISI